MRLSPVELLNSKVAGENFRKIDRIRTTLGNLSLHHRDNRMTMYRFGQGTLVFVIQYNNNVFKYSVTIVLDKRHGLAKTI
jgi:hypothetical protein